MNVVVLDVDEAPIVDELDELCSGGVEELDDAAADCEIWPKENDTVCAAG